MLLIMRKLALLTTFCIFGFASKATHLMGGQVTWEAINQDTLLATVTFYSDCSGTEVVPKLGYCIRGGNWNNCHGGTKANHTYDVTPMCKNNCNTCSNSSCSFKYGVKKHEQKVLVDVGYFRNVKVAKKITLHVYLVATHQNYTTLTGYKGVGLVSHYYLNNDLPSTIKYFQDPVLFTCLRANVEHNLGGYFEDDKGYKVSYHLKRPDADTANKIFYNSPYDYFKPLTFMGFPKVNTPLPGGFHLDSATGILRFRPTRLEHTLMAVEAIIWKNGKRITSITRQFDIVIMKCANNSPPVISGTNCRIPETGNFDFIACGGQSNCFSICVDDPNQNDSLILDHKGDSTLGSLKVFRTGKSIDSAQYCYSPSVADTGKEFQLVLDLNDNVCPIPAKSSHVYRVKVVPSYNANIKVKTNKRDSCGNYDFNAIEVNNNIIQDLRWILNDTLEFGQGTTAKYTFTKDGKYKITAYHKGCSDQYFDTVITVSNVKHVSINEYADTLLCSNQELDLDMNASGGHGTLDLQWNIPSSINVLSNDKKSQKISLSFNRVPAEQNLSFTYVATDSFGCKAEHAVSATIKDYEQRIVESDHSYCLNGDTILPLNLFNKQTGWVGQGVRNDTFFSQFAPREKLTLVYLNKENNRCIIDTATIGNYEPPTLNLGQSFTICKEGNDTLLNATPANGTWTGTAINSNGTFTPSLAKVGSNYLTYLGTDSNGCSNTDSLLINIVDYKPTLTLTDSAITCLNGDNLEITAQPKGGTWSAQGFSSTDNEISLDPSLFGAGTYEVVYSYKDSNQCSNADTAIAIINELPKPAFEVDSVVFQNDTLELSNQTTEINSTNYTWIITGPQNKTETGFEPQIIMDSLGMHSITLIATDAKTGCTDTLASNDSVKVVLNTGLQLGKIESLKVYPNPFNQELNFSNTTGQNLHYQIIAQDGKVVFEQNSNQATTNINLSHLAKGVYTLKITGNGFVEVQQVVKE
jgi:hypothetical protein